MNMVKYLTVMVMAVFLSACNSTPAVQFYVLDSVSKTNPNVGATGKPRSIGIGPVSMPALLEHKQIVRRLHGNTVQLAEFQQWASPLQDNLLQVLTRNLASLQPSNIVRVYPWSIHGTVDLQVIIDIIRFDTTPGESANLEANWTIKNESSRTALKNGHTVINHTLVDKSYPGTVHALSKLLGEFSQEISLALLKLESTH
jgi:uncharacterized protein